MEKILSLLQNGRKGSCKFHLCFTMLVAITTILSVCSAKNEVVKHQPQDLDVRLRAGTRPWEGRLEIYIKCNDKWYTLCNTPPRESVYHVVCKTLGFGSFIENKKFPSSSLDPLPGHFECNREVALSLRDCFLSISEDGGCGSNEEETGIVCSGDVQGCAPISFQRGDHREMYPYRVSYPADARVDVICPSNQRMSGIMKCVNGHWEWEGEEPPPCPALHDDTVHCLAPSVDHRYHFLRPLKMVYQHGETFDVVCRDHSNLTKLRCGDNGHLKCNIGDEGDCIPETPICLIPMRQADENIILVGGNKPSEGRVLVKRDDQWGSICADGWTLTDSNVVCSQLGFGSARQMVVSPKFPPGAKNYLFRNVNCDSKDKDILSCLVVNMLSGDRCKTDVEVEVDCFAEEPQVQPSLSSSAQSNCGPPVLLPNMFATPFKYVYEPGEHVRLSCSSSPEHPKQRKLETILTCASDGLWRGDVISCGDVSNCYEDLWLMIKIGIAIILAQVCATILPCCCCIRASKQAAPVAGKCDKASPPDDDTQAQPANQKPVPIQPQPRQTDEVTPH